MGKQSVGLNTRALEAGVARALKIETHWAMLPEVLQQMHAELLASAERGAVDLSEIQGGFKPVDPVTVIGGVAVIDVTGPLAKSPGLFRLMGWPTGATLPELEQAAVRVAADDQIRGAVLRIDSPGGTIAGTPAVADAVAAIAARKPVATWAPDMMASAAYWIGTQAHHLVVGEAAKVGSIGTYAAIFDVSEMTKRMGIEVKLVKSARLKGAGTPGTAITSEQVGEFQRITGDLASVFVAGVARGRGVALPRAQEWHDGRVRVGAKAVRDGLADQVGTFRQAVQWVHRRLRQTSSKPARGQQTSGPRADAGGVCAVDALDGPAAPQAAGSPGASAPLDPAGDGGEGDEGRPVARGDADLIASERARARTIRVIGRQLQMDAGVIEEHIEVGTSVDDFRLIAMAHAGVALAPIESISPLRPH